MKSISDCLTPDSLSEYFLDRYLGWDINVKSTINIDVTETKIPNYLIKNMHIMQNTWKNGWAFYIDPQRDFSTQSNSIPRDTSYSIVNGNTIRWKVSCSVSNSRYSYSNFRCSFAYISLGSGKIVFPNGMSGKSSDMNINWSEGSNYASFEVSAFSLPGTSGSGACTWKSPAIKGRIVNTGDNNTSYIDFNANDTFYIELAFDPLWNGRPGNSF